ncbi:MAG TPA: hypothetical protein VG708_05660 [Mycobacteriales bacterium]|nr:hypothetical protein [Mycobacteriales bacterium]
MTVGSARSTPPRMQPSTTTGGPYGAWRVSSKALGTDLGVTSESGQRAANLGAQLLGTPLGSAFALLARVTGRKPLHPKGVLLEATLRRNGSHVPWGVPWLDEPGHDQGIARVSRSMGLPSGMPDVLGLAVRFGDDASADGAHDLLLATTGLRPVFRHVLVPRRGLLAPAYTSLLPYDAHGTRLLFAATRVGGETTELPGALPVIFELAAATPLSPWQPFATLRLDQLANDAGGDGDDERIRFDPVCNPLPGLTVSPVIVGLREPAYAGARSGTPRTR